MLCVLISCTRLQAAAPQPTSAPDAVPQSQLPPAEPGVMGFKVHALHTRRMSRTTASALHAVMLPITSLTRYPVWSAQQGQVTHCPILHFHANA
jgi:hypothetical protein